MFNKKEETASLLRQILAEQKKQTKILQAIESSKENLDVNELQLYLDQASWSKGLPKGDINNPIAEPIQCIPSKVKRNKGY